jgi:hypothetical protein
MKLLLFEHMECREDLFRISAQPPNTCGHVETMALTSGTTSWRRVSGATLNAIAINPGKRRRPMSIKPECERW